MSQTQVRQQVLLVSPTAEQEVKAASPAPRLLTLKGATIAVVNALKDPDRSNGELLSRQMGELLQREGAGQVIPLRKKDPGRDMPEELLSHIVSQAQGAIILEGD